MNTLDKKVLMHQLHNAMESIAHAQVEIRAAIWALEQQMEQENQPEPRDEKTE